MWLVTRSPSNTRFPGRFSIDLPDDAPIQLHSNRALAISPDGFRIAYVAMTGETTQIHIRETNRFEIKPVSGTEGARYPFFSPDGRWIGYCDTAAKLKKVSVRGGAPVELCDTGMSSRGASWGESNIIVFNQSFDSGLSAVSAYGGTPRIVTVVDQAAGEKTHRFPHILPGGQQALFVIGTSTISSYDEATIAVVSMETGERKVLIEGGGYPRYAPTGHIVYAREGGLMAVPFDLDELEVTGAPVAVLEGLMTSHTWGAAQFSLSDDGVLVYVPGGPDAYYNRLVWLDRKGNVTPVSLTGRSPLSVRLSPAEDRVVVHAGGANDELWLNDLSRGTLTRLTTKWDIKCLGGPWMVVDSFSAPTEMVNGKSL
jgi:serine/threonine-protein kinase